MKLDYWKKVKKNIFLIAALGSSLTACDVRTELKEMHDNTKKMEGHTAKMVDITEKMQQTTAAVNQSVDATNQEMVDTKASIKDMTAKMDHLSETTDSLNSTIKELHESTKGLDNKMSNIELRMNQTKEGIDETYDGLRQGDSADARRKSFLGLINAVSLQKKLSEAAFYFAAFEYQLYNGKGLDEEMFRRQKLVLTGVQQFFKDIYEVYNYNPSVNPFADPLIGRETNLEASFNAIAAALHKENPKQKESIEALNNKGMQLREIQFLELIKQGLLDGEKLKNREVNLSQISDISREVLNNEDVSVKLLQARWAILLVAALDKDVTFHKGGSWRYFISAWKLITKWDLDFSKINSSDLDEQRKYLKASLETRDFLTSIGVKTETPSLAKMFIQRMRPLNIEKLSESDQQVANDILEYLAKLKK